MVLPKPMLQTNYSLLQHILKIVLYTSQINTTDNNALQSTTANASSVSLNNNDNKLTYSVNWSRYGFKNRIKFSVIQYFIFSCGIPVVINLSGTCCTFYRIILWYIA